MVDFPAFVSHGQMKEYFELYCKKFDLNTHIKLNHEVILVSEPHSSDSSERSDGRWRITTKSHEGHKMWVFDKVVIAIGRFQTPVWPDIEGINKFHGTILHAAEYNPAFSRL